MNATRNEAWLGRLVLLSTCAVMTGCPRGADQSASAAPTGTERSAGPTAATAATAATTTTTARAKVVPPAGSSDPGCRDDSDCVATFNMGSCCNFYCEGYPVSRWEHQRRQAATASCGPGERCPPQAPCPPKPYRIEAACDAGTCVAKKVPRAGSSSAPPSP